MAVTVVLNGVSYSIPEPGDTAWGQDLTDYFVAQASGLLQKAGGTFSLTAEVDFGATFGLKSVYFKSRAVSPATSGQVRLGNTESVSWRNAANSANLALSVNASDQLTFNGTAIQPAGNYISALTGDVTATGPGSVAATIAAGAVDNAKVSASAAIAYSKLNLSGSIVNADIGAAAAIDYSKLAALTVSRALVSSAGGVVSVATTTSTEIGYVNGVTSSIQTQLNSKQATGNFATSGSGDVAWSAPSGAGPVTTSYSGTVPLNKGGTGQTTKAPAFDALSPMSASGDIIYGGASGTGTRLAKGSDGQILTLASGLPAWAAPAAAPAYGAPTVQKFTSGTGTYNKNYTFNIASGSATVGATYTNNGITYTVYATVASATQVVMSGSGAPTASGTLTKSGGTGDSTLTFTSVIAPLYLRVRMVGGGGGGAGGGTAASGGSNSGGAGGNTTFGSTIVVANGGSGGAFQGGTGTAGGTASLSGAVGIALTGGKGAMGGFSGSAIAATVSPSGGGGGNSAFGGAGGGGAAQQGNPGEAAAANTGGGGGGGNIGSPSAANAWAGPGGGAGGYADAIITAPSATYAYAVGSAGSAGTAGTNGTAGGAGSAGIIEVTEFYQ